MHTIASLHEALGSSVSQHTLRYSWLPALRDAGLLSARNGTGDTQFTAHDLLVLQAMARISGRGKRMGDVIHLVRDAIGSPADADVGAAAVPAPSTAIAVQPAVEAEPNATRISESEAMRELGVGREWIISARTRLQRIMIGGRDGKKRLYAPQDLVWLRRYRAIRASNVSPNRAAAMVLAEHGAATPPVANGRAEHQPLDPAAGVALGGTLCLSQRDDASYVKKTLLMLEHELVRCEALAKRIYEQHPSGDAAELRGTLYGALQVMNEITTQVLNGEATAA